MMSETCKNEPSQRMARRVKRVKQEAYSVYTVHGIALGRRAPSPSEGVIRARSERHCHEDESSRNGTAASLASLRSATLFAGDSPRP